MRYRFYLDVDSALAPVVGQIRVNADDDCNLYVNGHLVHENHDLGFSTLVDDIDIIRALRQGQNVLAIHAVDGEWGSPYNRGAERLLVEGIVATGSLEIVSDVCDLAPGDEHTTLFSFDFTPVSHDHNVAFEGTRTEESLHLVDGLYTTLGLGMTKVIDGDLQMPDLFGEPDYAFDVMNSSQGALYGNRLVFRSGDILDIAYVFLADDAFYYDVDSEADGIVDVADNCTLAANPGQTDTNGDGYGNACDADLTNDGNVNFGDVAAFKSAFFPRPYTEDAGLNSAGLVNFADLAMVRESFLKPPGRSAFAP